MKNAIVDGVRRDRLEGRPVHDRARLHRRPVRSRQGRRRLRAGRRRRTRSSRASCGWHSSVAVAQMEVTAKYKIPHFFAMGAAATINDEVQERPAKYGYWTTKGWPDPAKLTIGYVQAIEDAIAAGTFKPGREEGRRLRRGHRLGPLVRQGPQGPARAPPAGPSSSEDNFPTDQIRLLGHGLALQQRTTCPLIAGTTTSRPRSVRIPQGDRGLRHQVDRRGRRPRLDRRLVQAQRSASDYVVDQIPQFASDAAKKFAADYEAKYGSKPSPSAAGLSYDYANFFMKILRRDARRLRARSRARPSTRPPRTRSGRASWRTPTGSSCRTTTTRRDTIPDPIVGKGHFIFPVLQYMGGKATSSGRRTGAGGTLTSKP